MSEADPSWAEIIKTIEDPNWAEVFTAIVNGLLVVAAFLALLQIGHARRARHAEAATEAARRWDDPAFRKLRATVQKRVKELGPEGLRDEMMKLRDKASPEYFELLTILDYFEDLQILIKYRAISFRIVDDSLGNTVPTYWSIWAPFVRELRERNRDQRNYQNFEKLAKRIGKRHWYSIRWTTKKSDKTSHA